MVNFLNILAELKAFAESDEVLDIFLISVNQTKAEVTNRIHNSEKGSKSITGKSLKSPFKSKSSPYASSYAEYRKSIGRQTKVIDLELTSSLRKSLETIRAAESIKMGYLSRAEFEKILKLEKHFGEAIFGLSNDEEKDIKKNISKAINTRIEEIINGKNN